MNLLATNRTILVLALISLLSSCSLTTSKTASPQIKNVILLIGDGMGPQQIFHAIDYKKHVLPNDYPELDFTHCGKF